MQKNVSFVLRCAVVEIIFCKLFTCMMCTPWWVGFFLSLGAQISGYTGFSPFYSNGLENMYISIFLDSCLISGTTWLIHTVQEKLEE